MPKELIYTTPALTAGSRSYLVEHLAVGWDKEQRTVQMGFVQGPPVEIAIDGERADPGLWTDLDRGQINRLITVLRRARDAAFGADA